jgi:hypothetical protein
MKNVLTVLGLLFGVLFYGLQYTLQANFATRGVRGTGKIVADRLIIDMDNTIHLLDPNATPFTLLMSKLKKESVDNPEFNWLEDDFVPFTTLIDEVGGALVDATSLIVDDSTIFRVNDVITAPDVANIDNMLVTAINDATNTLTVVRQIGGGTAPAIPDDTQLLRIGNAFPEGTGAREILSTSEAKLYNYCQIFKKTFGVTETLKKTKTYGGDDLGWQRKKAGIEIAIEMEKAYWFGKRHKLTDATSGHPQRFMNGVLNMIQTNVQSLGGTWSLANFNSWLADIFKYGNPVKYVFCGEDLINEISNEAAGLVRMKQSDKTFGIAITEYVTPAGKKVILINNNRVFDIAPYDKYAVAIDLGAVKMIKFRSMVLKTNIQENDADEEKDQFIGEQSFKMMNEKWHGVLTDITT